MRSPLLCTVRIGF